MLGPHAEADEPAGDASQRRHSLENLCQERRLL
jgi:hypothetical protein